MREIKPQRSRDADAPRVEKKERPTLDGLEAFFGAAAGEKLEALWIVWCLTGLRTGGGFRPEMG
jgi:hypothetical protein